MILGPIAKTEMNIGDGANYTVPYEFKQGAKITLGNVTAGISNALTLLGGASNVEVNIGTVGPFNSLKSNTTDGAGLKKAELSIRLINNTGVTILSGTKLIIKLPTLTMPFIETNLSQNITPNSAQDIVKVILDNNYMQTKLGGISEVVLKDLISLSFENLKLRSTGQTISSSQSIELELNISKPSFSYLTLKPDAVEKSLDVSDKTSVNFSGGDTGVENIKDSLIVYMFNEMPITLYPQIYLYENESDTKPFDSLFRITGGVPFSVPGNTSRSTEAKFSISVNTYFQTLKKAKYMAGVTKIGFISNSPNDRVTIRDIHKVGFRLVLDSRLSLNNK